MSHILLAALHKMHRGVLLCGGFLAIMLLGAVLLMLPISQTGAAKVSFIDAFFMSVSTVSVTGMSMFDISRDFTVFGQLVFLVLMEIGGLGVMTMMALFSISTGRRIRLKERLLLRDSFNLQTPSGMVALVKKIIVLTFTIEFISGTLMGIYFCFLYGPVGLYMGYWHAISSFTTCGLDLMGGNFAAVARDPFVSVVTVVTMFLGGVGFLVLDDVVRKRSWAALSLNSKLILTMEAILIPLGVVVYYFLEGNNPATLGAFGPVEKWQGALFMSVASRLSGFSLFDIHAMMNSTVIVVMLFMIIGGAPVSTGGGIRTTTVGILLLQLWAWARGKRSVVIFHKQVAFTSLLKASNVFTLCVLLLFLTAFLLFFFEPVHFLFEDVVFEAVSAFSTVGFSMGLTTAWNTPCKLILMAAMFIGRIGILTLAIAFARNDHERVKYPEENVVVG